MNDGGVTKDKITEMLRDVLWAALGSGIVIIAIVAEEGEGDARVIHNAVSDGNAGDIMAAIAPIVGKSDA